jgi:methanogenic corrinoid protein MtbC1
MHPFYEVFLNFLDNEDKEKSVEFVLSKLNNKEIDIPTLYSEILEPALNRFYCDIDDKKKCIWKEHIRSSIIRTIIEICYPYIIKERNLKGLKPLGVRVLIGCPAEEHCDTGARMIADIFTLNGFESFFVGADTPREEIKDAVEILKPKFVFLNITNYYTLVEVAQIISLIREKTKFEGKIIVGGTAFLNNPQAYKRIGADILLKNYNEINSLVREI